MCFVTRLKSNASYEVIDERELPINRDILSDELIKFTGYNARKDCPIPLRRIVVWDAANQKEIILLTNHYEFGSPVQMQLPFGGT